MSTQFALRTADGHEYAISGPTRIGREADCQIRYDDPAISRHHATVSIEQGVLVITDNNSANGVFMDGRRLQAGRVYRLRPGDRVRLGTTQIEFEVATAVMPQPVATAAPLPAPGMGRREPAQTTQVTSRPARPWLRLACAGLIGGVLLLGFVLLPLAYFLLGGRLPGILTPISTKVSVLSVSTPPPLLKPQAYAASNTELVSAVAKLNQSELDFIHAATASQAFLSQPARYAPRAAELDNKLCQVAADALHVAATADALSSTSVAQDGGSDNAGQIASHYTSIAQLSAAIVLDSQNLRDKLSNGLMTPLDAAQVIAGYGARLWNPAVTDPQTPGNPFTPHLSDPASIPSPQAIPADNPALAAQTNALAWIAVSGQKENKTFTLPPSSAPPVDRNDAELLAALTTAAGQQTDSKAASQVAAAIIEEGGGLDLTADQPTGGEIVAAFWSATAVTAPASSNSATPSRTLPAFPGGTANAVTQSSPSGDVISSAINIGNEMETTLAGQAPVKETQPLVSLTISNIVVKQVNKRPKETSSTFEADVSYEFDVQWQVNAKAPQFVLDCVSGNHFEITTAGGSQHISAKGLLILYPGAEDVYCYASHNGNTWGSASTRFLVGDADQATQRAVQVETDSVGLDLTLTAEAVGTASVQQTAVAATEAVVGTANAVATEVYGTQTAEFISTVTEIARETAQATPLASETPLPTPTFVPVVVETLSQPGNVFAVTTSVVLKSGRLYRICLSGSINLTTGPAKPSDMEHVNGIAVPLSGCVVLDGTNSVATISCGSGETDADNPGSFAIVVYDLGPS